MTLEDYSYWGDLLTNYMKAQLRKRTDFMSNCLSIPSIFFKKDNKTKPNPNFLFRAFKYMATSFLMASLKVGTLIPENITKSRNLANTVLLENHLFLKNNLFCPEVPLSCNILALLFQNSKWKEDSLLKILRKPDVREIVCHRSGQQDWFIYQEHLNCFMKIRLQRALTLRAIQFWSHRMAKCQNFILVHD